MTHGFHSSFMQEKECYLAIPRVFIHYGSNHFDKRRFVPISNCNEPFPKPIGGFYGTYIIDGIDPWSDWCREENYETERLDKSFKFKIKQGARIIQVNETTDISRLPKTGELCNIVCLDFEELAKKYDAFMFFYGGYRMLQQFYGWDITQILVFNPDVVQEVTDGEHNDE